MCIIKYNEEIYTNFKGLALNSRHHKVQEMYEDSLQSEYLRKPESSVRWQSTSVTPMFQSEEGVKKTLSDLSGVATGSGTPILEQKLWKAKC